LKEKKIGKNYAMFYCNIPIKIKNFFKKFSPSVRKDIINRALFFYLTEGFYKELSPYFTEEELKGIQLEIENIYNIKIKEKNIEKAMLKRSKNKLKEKTEIIKTNEKLEENLKNLKIDCGEDDSRFDISNIDESIINEFDY